MELPFPFEMSCFIRDIDQRVIYASQQKHVICLPSCLETWEDVNPQSFGLLRGIVLFLCEFLVETDSRSFADLPSKVYLTRCSRNV
ncbi:hypothetical protein KP509_29G009500 [Ceratopteris richardii]|uniref:Uncharacterized protein n=1 Tax=Ceratopteris richardii TaxID=49495 RepID=A0A8T2R4N3_CERRI|nr:hypothetical protein KP509_29G009500 [Ceratopteris richardii]